MRKSRRAGFVVSVSLHAALLAAIVVQLEQGAFGVAGPSNGSPAYNNIGANTAGSVADSAIDEILGGAAGAAFVGRIGNVAGGIVSTCTGGWMGSVVTDAIKLK